MYTKRLFIAIIILIQYTNQSPVILVLAKTKEQSTTSTSKQTKKTTINTKRKLKTRSINFFKNTQEEDLLRSLTQVGIFWGLTSGTYAILGEKIVLSTIIGPILGNLFTEPLMKIGSKFSLLFVPKLAKSSLQKVLKLQAAYLKKEPYLSESMNIFIKNTLDRYMFLIDTYNYVDHDGERAIEEVLSFPAFSKKIDIATFHDIKIFLGNYPEPVRVAVGNFVVQMLKDSEKPRISRKIEPLMIVGPPGTGKTYLAKQLGKLLGVPTQVINIGKYSNLHGAHYSAGSSEKGLLVDILLDNKALQNSFTNKIIILDEVDKLFSKDGTGAFTNHQVSYMINYLLFLLESQETSINLPRYEGASHDISQLKIILIGNHTFSEMLGKDEAQPLESRVHLIKIDQLTHEQKLNIAKDHIAKIRKDAGVKVSDIDSNIIQKIVQEDIAAGYKGVRIMLQVIEKYIRMLEKSDLIKDISSISELYFDPKVEYSNRSKNEE